MAKRNKLSITPRLLLSFCILIVLFCAFGLLSVNDMRIVSSMTRTIYNHPLVVSNAALHSNVSVTKMHRSMKDVVLSDVPSKTNASIDAVNEQERRVYEYLDIVKENILGDEGRMLEKETRKLFEDWQPIRKQVIDLVQTGQRTEAARITMGKGADHVSRLEHKMLDLTRYARNKASIFLQNAEKAHSRGMRNSILFVLTGAVSSLLIAFFTLRRTLAAEKSITESEKRFRDQLTELEHIYNTSPVGLCMMDTDLRFVRINKKMAVINGKPVSEHIGRHLNDVLPEIASEVEPIYRKVIESGEPKLNFEVGGTTPAQPDVERHWLVSYYPVRSTDGIMLGVGTVVLEITEQKRAEKERAELERKLRQAQKIEALGVLAGGIAHDFNNILVSVIGYTELALMDVPEGTQLQENLREVLVAGTRARDLVKQILTFGRRAEKDAEPVQINPLVKEAIKMLRSTIPASIDIKEHVSRETLAINADATQIHQVIVNLATNAAHAMDKKGGAMEIGLDAVRFDESVKARYPDLEPGDYVRLSVSDNGTGIPEKYMNKIFDPYFTTKDKGKGTGLGLAVVHGIVKSHNGHIMVYSEAEKGTRVLVYLPLVKQSSTDLPFSGSEQLPMGAERILVVDDEPSIVEMQKQSLERLGYTVETRTGSLEALKAFRSAPDRFDLVITDMTMPNMTGDKLALEIKNIQPNVPVILCTGFSERLNSQNPSEINVDRFLLKPVDQIKMAKTVRDVLDGRGNPE